MSQSLHKTKIPFSLGSMRGSSLATQEVGVGDIQGGWPCRAWGSCERQWDAGGWLLLVEGGRVTFDNSGAQLVTDNSGRQWQVGSFLSKRSNPDSNIPTSCSSLDICKFSGQSSCHSSIYSNLIITKGLCETMAVNVVVGL